MMFIRQAVLSLLEPGTRKVALDPCAASQSFDLVFDPAQLPW